jgi:hypothetical protein
MFPLIFKSDILKFNDSSAALAGGVQFCVCGGFANKRESRTYDRTPDIPPTVCQGLSTG